MHFRDSVKIYATDVGDEALTRARQAVCSARDVAEIPAPLLEKYFEVSDDKYIFRKDLRRHVIFGQHDLIQGAPISRVDMLVCRNTLMYFNAETQAGLSLASSSRSTTTAFCSLAAQKRS